MNPTRLLLAAATLALAAPALAQFGGLNKLGGALDKAKQGLDAAKDAAKVAKAVTGLTLEEEKLIGDSVALEIASAYGGIWRDDDATRRVNLVGSALARYCDRPGLEWRFGLLDSDTVNAFSAPGGTVFLTRGLYTQLTTDDLLAAVLAHEIAHITGKHAAKIITRSEAAAVLTREATKRSSDAQALQAKADAAAAQVAEISPELAQFVDVSVGQIVQVILEKGFDPQTEHAADRDGRALAVTAGFAPGGLRAVLLRLQAAGAATDKPFSTHPPLATRLAKLPNDPTPPEPEPTPEPAAAP